ncbi:uncharacterized protein LOC132832507 [Hemiscyllium ocellatum]|uniref:uncharacterized protein LOC132832507 n=1 Tax=Hemiscyllium ocellatum TaxID=170820 RepID=UPI002966D6DE|nr:uncharacterized protein LOC132832507 [Hemiscyllium ocellatum]
MLSDTEAQNMPLFQNRYRLIVRSLCPDEKPRKVIDRLDLGGTKVEYRPFEDELQQSYLLGRCWWGTLRVFQAFCCGLYKLLRPLISSLCCCCSPLCSVVAEYFNRCPLFWRYLVCRCFRNCWYPRYHNLYGVYHTNLYGRGNLTDVRDSFYDNFLKYMRLKAGKSSLIFIVDDERNGKEAKEQIEAEHPTLRKCCDKIFVFEPQNPNGQNVWNQEEIRNLNRYLNALQQNYTPEHVL